MKGLAAVLLLVAVAANAQSTTMRPRGRVVTDTLWSQALGASKSIVIYLPASYVANGARRYPVAYYLHGAWGNEANWTVAGRIDQVMDSLVASGKPEMIIAMPDGDDSWYTTYNVLLDAAGCRRILPKEQVAERDCVAWPHYDDYIAFDVVRHVDAKYRTIASRGGRAIGGLSMGGYGAITLALQHPELFAAAVSHSGVLATAEFAPASARPLNLHRTGSDSASAVRFASGLRDRFRAIFGADSASWWSREPGMVARLATKRVSQRPGPLPALYADCGTGDVFLPQNRHFRDELAEIGLGLTYREWPGGHDWTYWRAHVGEGLAWIGERITPPTR